MNSLKNEIPISMRWKVSKEEIRKKLEQGKEIYKKKDIKEFPGIQYALFIENTRRSAILVSLAFLMNKETKIKAKFKILCISTNNFTYSDEQIFEESEERWGEYICSYKEFFDPSNNYFIDDYIYVTLEAIIRFENEPKVSINSEIKSSKNLGELMYNQNDDKDFDICFENGKCIKVSSFYSNVVLLLQ